MSDQLIKKVTFPKDFPAVTAGILLPDKKYLITGHVNGFVVKWDVENNHHKVLFRSDSPVRTISCSKDKKIAVGYHSGGLYILGLDEKSEVILGNPTHHKHNRVWRTLWTSNENLLITSTYGEISSFVFNPKGEWKKKYWNLKGHSNSVFGIDFCEKYLATGDYRGNVLIWQFVDNNFHPIQQLGVAGNVQDLCWHNTRSFTVITDRGKMYLIEQSGKKKQWQIVVEVDVARNEGICAEITDDGKTILVGTKTEIIQFDIESNQIQRTRYPVKRIFASGDYGYVLNNFGLYQFELKPIQIVEDLIKYRFVKISLLGHTQTGKSTFCSRILNEDIGKIYSTYGKKIFNLKLNDEAGKDKRIVLHDHGGQETVLDTFIPFMKDSDIILIFYKQVDKSTFERALNVLEEIKGNISENTKIYFVQTFIDHQLDEIKFSYEKIERLIENHDIVDLLKISPSKNIGLDAFEEKILRNIDWNTTKIMVQSPFIEGIGSAFSSVQQKGYSALPFETFREIYQKVVGKNISKRHLEFLLKDYTNQGVIEFYPEISDLIIFNDEEFNIMRTDLPMFVDQMKGVVDIKTLKTKFLNEEFLTILDEMYVKSGTAIKNGDLRIFPHKLPEGQSELPENYKECIADEEKNELLLTPKKIKIDRLITALSELELQCLELTKSEGLFAWEDNAFIYYFIQRERGSLKSQLKITFIVGGNKPRMKERLKTEFTALIERLYGPILKTIIEESKKKVNIDYEFDVALSFAGEQREYVENVATFLKQKGRKVFYDKFEQSQLWGRNLVDYFKEVYYSKSRFCIMFISNEYLRKMWPMHERRNATARDLEEFGEYILPVVFDKVDVPGLDKYRGYLNAHKNSPQQIAKIFLKKIGAMD